MSSNHDAWPAIPYDAWRDTCATLHMWTQIVGKIRLVREPWMNHSWQATLYLTARGLTTSPVPFDSCLVQFDFDFIDHALFVRTSEGAERRLALAPKSVSDFHAELFSTLEEMRLPVRIHGTPNEVMEAIPFTQDRVHRAYDADAAQRFWRALLQADRVLKHFRTGFLGKVSPVHFFWGSFDLAVTRFSGRRAPPHPGGVPHLPDEVTREAYSHEVSSAGFWAGGGAIDFPAFYSYAYPEPEGYRAASILPDTAYYHEELREFILPYDVVRLAPDPDATLLTFLQSTYEAAANNGNWDRAELDCDLGIPGVPRSL